MNLPRAVAIVACVVGFGALTAAGEPASSPAGPEVGSLSIGDPAPALGSLEWVKGTGPATFEKGTVYAVEFWATWCGPCVASMPHLSDLQREHHDRNFQVVAITAQDPQNTIEAVRKLVDSMGDKIAYPIGFDASGETLASYMMAAAVATIPCTFLLDREGRVAWIGLATELDTPLKAVLDGTWDAAAFAPKFRAAAAKVAPGLRIHQALVAKDGSRLIREARAYFEATPDDPIQAFSIALYLVHPKMAMIDATHDPVLLDFAIELLNKALVTKEQRSALTYSLLARAHSLRGNAAEAVEAQKKSVAAARTDADRERLNARLAEYEKAVTSTATKEPN